MDVLPVEVVEHILSFLGALEDRKSASLVCRQWYYAFMNPKFRQNEIVNITADRHLKSIMAVYSGQRPYLHFVMKKVNITFDSLPFWQKFGLHIKTLSFVCCDIRDKVFIKALSKCISLEALNVDDCNEMFMSGRLLEDIVDCKVLKAALGNLKSLSLKNKRYLSDSTLMKLLMLCPNINTIIFDCCQINYHGGLFKKFYSDGSSDIYSDSVTTFQMLHRFIAKNARQIKQLSFSSTNIDTDSLCRLSMTENLALNTIKLQSCTSISNQGFIQMSINQTTITEIDLSFCTRLTDESLIAVFYGLTNLKKLSLECCHGITDIAIANIWQLKNLLSLNLSECKSVLGAGIFQGLCCKKNFTLSELHLRNLFIADIVVKGLAEFLPNLRHLDLSGCTNGVTDCSVQCIFKHLTLLRSLNMAKCTRITDRGLTGVGIDKTNDVVLAHAQLLNLPLDWKGNTVLSLGKDLNEKIVLLQDDDILVSNNTGVSLSNLKGLKSLNLSKCSYVSDLSLKHTFNLIELKNLDLSHCQRITSDGLSCLVQKCKSIEDLNLDMCINIDDEGANCVFCDLPRLKKINFGSHKLTNRILTFIIGNAQKIRYINLMNCDNINGTEISYLQDWMPFLETVEYAVSIDDCDDDFVPPSIPWYMTYVEHP